MAESDESSSRTVVRKSAEGVPVIHISDHSLDFGTVNETADFTATIPIHNRNAFPVEVQDVSASCNCTSAEVTPRVIVPHGVAQLTLKMDLQRNLDESAVLRPVSANLIITTRPGGRYSRTAKCLVKPSIAIIPQTIDLGTVVLESTPNATREILLKVEQGVVLEKLESPPWISIQKDTSSPAGDIYSLSTIGMATQAWKKGVIQATCSTPDGTAVVCRGTVTCRVVPEFSLHPGMRHLGVLSTNDELEKHLTLTSHSKRSFDVRSIEIMPDNPQGIVAVVERQGMMVTLRVQTVDAQRGQRTLRISVTGEEHGGAPFAIQEVFQLLVR